MGIVKKSKASFNNMLMLAFKVAIFLMFVGWSSDMSDAMGGKKGPKNCILTSLRLLIVDF